MIKYLKPSNSWDQLLIHWVGRKIGVMYAVDLDIELDGSMSVQDAHEVIQKMEKKIHEAIPNLYDIMIHMEPIGNIEEKESYGLRSKDLRNNSE